MTATPTTRARTIQTINQIFFALLSMTIAASVPLSAGSAAPASSGPTIFDNVAAILRERYYDRKFRDESLPALIEKYRPAAGSPSDLASQRRAAEALLARVPASHLGLLSEESFQYLVGELSGWPQPSFGFHLVRSSDKFYLLRPRIRTSGAGRHPIVGTRCLH